jgi:hypothetical protein
MTVRETASLGDTRTRPMTRPIRIACIALFAALAAPAAAQDTRTQVQDAIIAQLTGQGFTHIRVSNTFLGRVRIYATSPGTTREIIFNPRTGEILRDYWDDEDDFGRGLVSPAGPGGQGRAGNGEPGDDRDGDDDRDDDDREDDDRDRPDDEDDDRDEDDDEDDEDDEDEDDDDEKDEDDD